MRAEGCSGFEASGALRVVALGSEAAGEALLKEGVAEPLSKQTLPELRSAQSRSRVLC